MASSRSGPVVDYVEVGAKAQFDQGCLLHDFHLDIFGFPDVFTAK